MVTVPVLGPDRLGASGYWRHERAAWCLALRRPAPPCPYRLVLERSFSIRDGQGTQTVASKIRAWVTGSEGRSANEAVDLSVAASGKAGDSGLSQVGRRVKRLDLADRLAPQSVASVLRHPGMVCVR